MKDKISIGNILYSVRYILDRMMCFIGYLFVFIAWISKPIKLSFAEITGIYYLALICLIIFIFSYAINPARTKQFFETVMIK